jgi:uncharacterized protein YjdB
VATVSASGLVTGVSAGTATITAASGELSGTDTVTITAATVTSIAVTPTNPSLPAGLSMQLRATATMSDQTTQDVTTQATWTSSSSSVATVNNETSKGLVAGVAAGSATISATFGGKAGTANATITRAELDSISVTPTAPSIAAGTSVQFTATGIFSDGTTNTIDVVAWTSSSTEVATINSSGLATSSKAGTSVIRATMGDVTSPPVTLTVTGATLASIAVTPALPSIALGTKQQFVATGTYSDNSTQPLTSSVTWASASEDVAEISNAQGTNGLATPLKLGTSAITASLDGVTSLPVTLTVTDATLVSIAVTPALPSIALGTKQQFVATGTYSDNSTQPLTSSVTWASAAEDVAEISNAQGTSGLATPLKVGTSAITASLDGVTSPPVTLTVTGATLVSIAVTPPNPSIPAGLSEQFTAIGTYTDNTTQDLTSQVSWSSSDVAVATISNAQGSNGLATAIATGSTSITAALGEVESSAATLTVNALTLRNITISPANATIPLATSLRFSATGHYSDDEATSTVDITTLVTWGSAAPLDLSVSNAPGSEGLAEGLVETEGSVRVSATLSGVSGYADATVTSAALVSIAITPSSGAIPKGLMQDFIATGTYSDGTTADITTSVTWSSSDEAVATVSNDPESQGRAFGAGVGSATITAVHGQITGSATLQVTAATLVSIAVTPPNPSVPAGSTQQFTATGTYTDETTQDITGAVTWASDTLSVATVSNAAGSNGLATTSVAGTAHITAAQGDVTSPSATLTVTDAELVRIEVTPVSASIPNGTTQQLSATGVYTDSSTQDLTESVAWESSNTDVVGVSNTGLATGLAVGGPVTISATLELVTGAASLTVTDAVLSSIAVSSDQSVIPVTLTASFTATGTYTDSTTADITNQVTWAASSPEVATISNAAGTRGVATALTAGSTTISATLGQISGSRPLTVSSAQLTAVLVSANCQDCENSTPAGLSLQFTATGLYSDESNFDITRFATWGTLDQSVAVVSNAAGSQGLLTGLVAGTTSIYATYQSVSGATAAVVTNAQLLAVQIDPPAASIPNGNTHQFHAVGSYTDNIPRDITSQVTWASSDPNIASVSNAQGTIGLAQSITPATGHTGSTTITATDPGTGYSGSATLTVTDAVLRQIAITPPNPSLPKGTSQNLTAMGTYSDSTTQDLTSAVTWSSSDEGVVGVSAGVANGLELGTATVTATHPSAGVSGTTAVTVTAAELKSIAVEPSTSSIAKGTSVQFAAIGTYSDSSTRNITADVAWTSGDEAVATVSNSTGNQGFASGAGTGSTAVTATKDGVSGSANITVTAATVVSIALSPETRTLAKGTTVQYRAVATFTDETTQDLTGQLNWQSSDGVVASVSNLAGSRGLATALTTGTATITATNGSVTGTASLTVTNAVLQMLTISPTDSTMPVSSTLQFTATGHYSDGTTQDLTSQSSWSTTTPSVVTISNSQGSWGLATALTPGSVTVTAASSGRTASTTATVLAD